jgi:alpha-amylase
VGAVVDAACPDTVGPGVDAGTRSWVCQHRWAEVVPMVSFRGAVGDAELTDWWEEGPAVAFGRGDRGFVVVNKGDAPLEGTWTTSLPTGEYCDVQTGPLVDGSCTGDVVTVAEDGTLAASVPASGAIAVHVDAQPADAG